MKYLDITELSLLTSYLSRTTAVGDHCLRARIEAYSCKAAGDDKKLWKTLERQYSEEIAADPVTPVVTPLGDFSDAHTRRLLVNLIATLNASFPDHDFSTTKPEQFRKIPTMATAMQSVNKYLAEAMQAEGVSLVDQLWRTINDVIDIGKCEVYCYIPNLEDDPFSAHALWSFNYFMVNKAMKKILYFFCVCESQESSDAETDDESDHDVILPSPATAGAGGGAWLPSQEDPDSEPEAELMGTEASDDEAL